VEYYSLLKKEMSSPATKRCEGKRRKEDLRGEE